MESRLVLYADDIVLFCPIRTIGDYSALQADIDALSLGHSEHYDIQHN